MGNKKDKPYLVYAIAPNGAMAHIDSVPNGMGCGCICPHCKDKLLAKNGGTLNAHHFAHRDGADCVGAVESALHMLAKEVLSETLCLMLPNGEIMRFDKVAKEEYNSELALRPDCVGYYGDKILWIEFKRTHAVDVRKEEKIVSAHIDCMEIDLNKCEQDKEKVRNFITQSKDERKWIYSAKYGRGISNRRNRTSEAEDRERYDEWEEYITRHFAIEDGQRLIDLEDIADFDALHHKYTCPSCGRDVVLRVGKYQDYYFEHLDEKVLCDDEMYLQKAAVAALYKTISEAEHFVIIIPQFHKCRLFDSCKFYNEAGCEARREHSFDIKQYGYTRCLKNYRFDDAIYQTDLVLCRDKSLENAIEIIVNTENIEKEITTKRRLIKFFVRNESSIRRLQTDHIGSDYAHFVGFNDNGKGLADPIEINRELTKFTFYSSGKFFPEHVKCTDNISPNNSSKVLKEAIFVQDGDYDDMRNYLLMSCRKQGLKICYCHLCFFLSRSSGYFGAGKYFCKRYKTKGTPQFPLDATPIDCPYFMLDNEIKARIAGIAEQLDAIEIGNFQHIK